ncbi:hypothetical protein KIL84_005294, partial [Mauremys mutica]
MELHHNHPPRFLDFLWRPERHRCSPYRHNSITVACLLIYIGTDTDIAKGEVDIYDSEMSFQKKMRSQVETSVIKKIQIDFRTMDCPFSFFSVLGFFFVSDFSSFLPTPVSLESITARKDDTTEKPCNYMVQEMVLVI